MGAEARTRKQLVGEVAELRRRIAELEGSPADHGREDALRASEKQYRDLVETSHDLVFKCDGQGRFTYLNPAWERALGYSVDEMIGRPFNEFKPPEIAERDSRAFKNILKGEDVLGYETVYVTKSGQRKNLVFNARLLRDADGELIGTQGTAQDITDRKQAEEALATERRRLYSVLEGLPAFVYLQAPDHSVRYANKFFRQHFGDPGERPCYEILWGREAPCEVCPTFRVFDTKEHQTWEWTKAPDGQAYEINDYPFTDTDGSALVLEMGVDITGRKRAEQALRESETLVRAVMDNLPVGVAVNSVDPTIDFEYMNDSFPKHYRTTREALADPDAFWNAVYEAPKFRQEMKKRILDDCASGDPDRMQWEDVPITRKGQATAFISARNIPVLDKQLMISIVWDVTERKRAEEERLDLERQVQHAQKLESLGVLAGGIAHDFNNLLAVMIGNADMALRKLPELSPARSSVEEIKKAGMRATHLTNQMLAYSGRGRFLVKPLDLNDLIGETGNLLQASIPKKVTVQYDLASELPTIEADLAQMEQVVMNLMTNAAEAIGDERGTVTVRTGLIEADRACLAHMRLSDDLPDGSYVYLEVTDTGHGMNEQTQSKLFEPFFTTKFTGRGLGMAAVLGIVRSHKGAIRLDSEVGKGTTFRLLFPPSKEAAPPAIVPVDGGADEARLGGGTILVVDDEPSVRDLAKRMLEGAGFDVLTAPNGREAVALFGEHADEVSLVLLDLTMPEMSGEEAFEKLRRIRPDVPVLLCSGYAEEDATSRFEGKSPAGFIHKPFELDEMIAKVRHVLQR